jgi:hypothetical protein
MLQVSNPTLDRPIPVEQQAFYNSSLSAQYIPMVRQANPITNLMRELKEGEERHE